MLHTYYFSHAEYKYWNRHGIDIEILHNLIYQSLLYAHQRDQNINTFQQALSLLPDEYPVHLSDLYL